MMFSENKTSKYSKFLLERYVDDASFFWLLRDKAIHAPHYSLKDLAKLDGRVEANIDGLRIADDAGWEICKEAMAAGESGEVFTSAVLAIESGEDDRIQTVLEVVKANPDSFYGLLSALEWLPWQVAERYITGFTTDEFPVWRYAGLAAFAAHGRDPGQPLMDALSDQDTHLATRALKAVGELGKRELLPLLQNRMSDADDFCRFNAAWSAALLGDGGAAAVLKLFAEPGIPWAEEAVKMSVRCMAPATVPGWLYELSRDPATLRLAIIGAGILGDPVMVSWLLDQMTIPELARVAGESFTMITGVDLAFEDLDGDRPEGFESGPTENPEDEDVSMDPDEDLPWPNAGLLRNWWSASGNKFRTGTRHLLGEPITSGHLQQVLKTGRQRQRESAALESALLQPGRPLFMVSAPGSRQKQLLGL